MKRKILLIMLCGVMIFSVTGCGGSTENYTINEEYKEYIDLIRNAEGSAYLGNHTMGELFDNALIDSTWDEYTKELSNGVNEILISVKGTSKFDEGEEIEVIYRVDTKDMEYSYYKMYVNGDTSGGLMSLMKESADDLDSQNQE